MEGYVFAIPPCREGEGYFVRMQERAPKDWEAEGLRHSKRISPPVSQTGSVSQAYLLHLVQEKREEAEGKGNHKADPPFR